VEYWTKCEHYLSFTVVDGQSRFMVYFLKVSIVVEI